MAAWNTAQPVTLTGDRRRTMRCKRLVTITHTIDVGVDNAIVANGILRATVRESDTRGVTVKPTSR